MLLQRISSCLLASVLLVVAACSRQPVQVPVAAGVSAAEQRQAAVAMPDPYAAEVSQRILEAGGNAVDAAIAAGFALAVTYPQAGNIGGGGFMLIHMNGEDAFLDYREKAPLAATRDMYLDARGEVIPESSQVGHQSIGVPGTVAGFWAAHQRYGSMPWGTLVEPAIRLAQHGFVVSDHLGGGMLTKTEDFASRTNFAEYFGAMRPGNVFRQPELAQTLRRIAGQGPDDFYRGETAALIVAEMRRGNGLITLADLARYRAQWREPLRARWRDYEVVSAPPPSSGGFALIQLLKMRDFDQPYFAGVAHNSTQYVHLVAELEKRVFADRAEYLGDPDFVDNRMDELLSDDYLQARAAQVDPKHISMNVGPGLAQEQHDTTHFSILDDRGNAVSNTYTLNLGFGSGVVVEGAGFLLNDEMDDFSAKPGVPNAYGVVGSAANAIEPEKRMLSSMTPTILLQDGRVAMVVGTPGGATIFTSVFQAILNIVDFDMSAFAATDAARFHHQLLPPDAIYYGPSRPLPPETVSGLEGRGYRVTATWDFGDLQLIYVDDGEVSAASDPRHGGESRVFD